jgi:hypothetical protein
MRNVEKVVLKAVTVKTNAARARHQRTRHLRRQPLAALPHGIFLSGPIPRVAPCPEIGFRPLCQKHAPRCCEVGAGLIKGGGSIAAPVFAWTRARIEATAPFPLVGIVWVTGALGDRAGVHVTGNRRASSPGVRDSGGG